MVFSLAQKTILLAQLAAILGPDQVLDGTSQDAAPYLTDSYGRVGMAHAVVRPRDEQALRLLVLAAQQGGTNADKHNGATKGRDKQENKPWALVPMGGNSGRSAGALVGAAAAKQGALAGRAIIIVSMAHFNRIIDVDAASRTMLVESGVVLDNIQQAAAAHGLAFPLALGASGSCQIGGNIATNAGGYNAVRYGMTRGLVLGLDVMLADGTMLSASDSVAVMKNNSGYDWRQWFIGSEGTLGFIVRARLQLFPKPKNTLVGLVAADHLAGMVACGQELTATFGSLLSGFELIPDLGRELLLSQGQPVPAPLRDGAHYPFYGLFEVENFLSTDNSALLAALAAAEKLSERVITVAQDSRQASALWQFRESIVGALRRLSGVVRHDIALPPRAWATAATQINESVAAITKAARPFVFGHVGDGNLHYHFLVPRPDDGNDAAADDSWRAQARAIHKAVYDNVLAHGGSFSAEHGVGRSKAWAWHRYQPAAVQDISQRLKKMLDPHDILNPGVIFDLTK